MKITGQRPPQAHELGSGKARESEAKPERLQHAAKDGAHAVGNRTSLTMQRIREAIRTTPDMRADRVEALREQVRTGTYRVDADRLAQNLLTESLRDDVEKP